MCEKVFFPPHIIVKQTTYWSNGDGAANPRHLSINQVFLHSRRVLLAFRGCRRSRPSTRRLVETEAKKKPQKKGARSKQPKKRASWECSMKAKRTAGDLVPIPVKIIDRGPDVALAYTYLGDAVWELYARQHMILRSAEKAGRTSPCGTVIRPQEATKLNWCSSVAMSDHLARLLADGTITDDEISILEWGRNFGHESRSGHKTLQHREASSLEALIAYWYLFDQDRLHLVLSHLGMILCRQPVSQLTSVQVKVTMSNVRHGRVGTTYDTLGTHYNFKSGQYCDVSEAA